MREQETEMKSMSQTRQLLILAALLAGLVYVGYGAPLAAQPANQNSPLAVNLAALEDWGTGWAFVDAFKSSRYWVSSSSDEFDDGRPLALDEHGWVTRLLAGQRAETLIYTGIPGAFPGGHYIVLYDGQGTIVYTDGTRLDELSTPGRDVVNVDGGSTTSAIRMSITATNPADYLRNIRVIMPGGVCTNDQFAACLTDNDCSGGACSSFESNYRTQIFHPLFLSKIKRFSGLRFMDWMLTNNSKQSAWSDRPKVEDAQYTHKGAPLEVMIELANRVQADPWFCMPHLADDDYIRNFAALVASQLQPQRKAYVEHSNEVWNGMFDQAEYAQRRGRELGLGSDDFEGQMRYHSQRSVEIFRIWTSQIQNPQRLVRTMGGWTAVPWAVETVLDWQSAYQESDALAIAPYFGYELGNPRKQQRVAAWPVARLLRFLDRKLLPRVFKWIDENRAAAEQRGLQLIAYEGGQHLVGYGGAESNRRLTRRFIRANRHPGMHDLYIKYLNYWLDSGGGTFALYNHAGTFDMWGSWGLMEHYYKESSPKYEAVMEIIDSYSMNREGRE
jgi:hypothetical protein